LGSHNRPKNKGTVRLPVDKEKWGVNDNTYSSPPDYYYDEEFKCRDCGIDQVWTAEQQKNWYEELGKTINSTAVCCRVCRAHLQAIKEQKKRYMEEMKNIPKHPNEEFFKNT